MISEIHPHPTNGDEYIELTKSGGDVGKEMRRRHGVLNKFLTEILKIDAKVADDEACKMEHTLSSETLDSLVDFMEFIQTCPRAGESWLNNFEEYRKNIRQIYQFTSTIDYIPFRNQVDNSQRFPL